jgi:hypothetical protein|tara:strand:+ start:2110 stop:2226 length:117 start_codon:yes stop_codon:yes gene_type:complete
MDYELGVRLDELLLELRRLQFNQEAIMEHLKVKPKKES